ncbi:CG13196 [Drosophila busckii]|uniref:CG13196 n=1 Tax=Drosophila busckii TaxID=30019 RepID=A0A0M4EDF5_DROBS|nr:uncharacterized protein LOC108594700 [Drosophila busckii]ALC41001.1 CG13196 [Drosophila busckii]
MSSSWIYLILFSFLQLSRADVSHYYAAPAEFSSYPFQFALPPPPAPAYVPTAPAAPPPVAPAPVAPVAATTEFSLPEIVENRSLKHGNAHGNFIPLSQHYLPPTQEQRPNYESPKPSDEFGGYYYQQPSSTITTTSTTSKPIVVQDSSETLELEHGYDYQVPARPSTPAPVYLPPSQLNAEQQQQQLRLRLKDMRCLQSGYFRAVLKLDSFLGAAPVLDLEQEQLQDKRCELKLSRSLLLLDIAGADFERCGVRSCGEDLCLRLRFPAIRGLRTAADAILTLHCKTQERVAYKTHALKMGVANDAQSRSAGSYAHGGNQNAFRTHVELLRRGSNGYTRQLETDGAVQLGEDLLLRAHVLAGDGWNYTKLSDVQLQRISPSGELLNSAQLITTRGCLNPAMQSVCAHAPSLEPPLGQRLHFKAIMFPGMHSGDLLVMSMRLTGCLEHEDCQLTPQDCLPGVAQRRRRDTPDHNSSAASEISHLSFRVLMPQLEARELEQSAAVSEQFARVSKSMALFGTLGFVVLLMGVAIIAIYKLRK